MRQRRPRVVRVEPDEARRLCAFAAVLRLERVCGGAAAPRRPGDRVLSRRPPLLGRRCRSTKPTRTRWHRSHCASAIVYERAVLRQRLRVQHQDMRRMASWADARTSELGERSIMLDEDAAGADTSSHPARSREHEPRLRDLLTRRELEVLKLMVRGETNARIARELRALRRHGQVPCQERPAQAPCRQPRRSNLALPALDVEPRQRRDSVGAVARRLTAAPAAAVRSRCSSQTCAKRSSASDPMRLRPSCRPAISSRPPYLVGVRGLGDQERAVIRLKQEIHSFAREFDGRVGRQRSQVVRSAARPRQREQVMHPAASNRHTGQGHRHVQDGDAAAAALRAGGRRRAASADRVAKTSNSSTPSAHHHPSAVAATPPGDRATPACRLTSA